MLVARSRDKRLEEDRWRYERNDTYPARWGLGPGLAGWPESTGLGSRERHEQPHPHSSIISQDNFAPPNRESFALDMSGNTAANRNSVASQQQYNTLERANRQFANQNQGTPDPFMEQARSLLTARPYSQYSTASRISSVESIATIVDEKQNLNKATESVHD